MKEVRRFNFLTAKSAMVRACSSLLGQTRKIYSPAFLMLSLVALPVSTTTRAFSASGAIANTFEE